MLHFTEFKLNDNFGLEAGIFDTKIIKDLHEMTKNDLLSSVKLSPIFYQPIGFEKQKVWPVFKIFSKEVNDGIKLTCKNNKNALH